MARNYIKKSRASRLKEFRNKMTLEKMSSEKRLKIEWPMAKKSEGIRMADNFQHRHQA